MYFTGEYDRDTLAVVPPGPLSRPRFVGGAHASTSELEALYWTNHDIGREEHALEFLDASGEVLASIPLPMDVSGFRLECEREPYGRVGHIWRVAVLNPPDYASYRIVAALRVLEHPPYELPVAVEEAPADGGSSRTGSCWRPAPLRGSPTLSPEAEAGETMTVVEVDRSENPPSVWLEPPVAREGADGDVIEVAWRASDPDCNALSHLLRYTLDDGRSYKATPGGHIPTDARNYKPRVYELPVSLLERSKQARVMVIVSDGTLWAAAEAALPGSRSESAAATPETESTLSNSPGQDDPEGYERAGAGLCI